jgi:hypothetical protein
MILSSASVPIPQIDHYKLVVTTRQPTETTSDIPSIGEHHLIQASEGYTNCMEESVKKNSKFMMTIMQALCESENPTTAPKTVAEKQAMAEKFGLDISVFN